LQSIRMFIGRLVRIMRLFFYFIILKHLPPTYYPVSGKLVKQLRYLCCKPLFRSCGLNVTIESKAVLPFHKVDIGNNSGIGLNARIGSIKIGANVLMGSDVMILTRNHNYDKVEILIRLQGDAEEQPVIIENDVWIGARVIVLTGVHIGKGVVIGAGAVVAKDLPDYSIAAGNPARVVRVRD